jgi:DUF2917 family protein
MTTELKSSLVQLDRRQLVELIDAAGVSVTCMSGSLWITEHKEFADIVLGPGQSFVLDGRGKVVVQALAASTMRLLPPVSTSHVAARAKTLFSHVGEVKPA